MNARRSGYRNKHLRITLIIISIITVTIAIAVIGYLGYCHYPQEAEEAEAATAVAIAPEELLGMEKMTVASGEDALTLVKQSHRGKIEHVRDMAIMHYMNTNGSKFLTLWTTLYPSDEIAYNEARKMAAGMRNWGDGWASNLNATTIAGKQVYITSPDGITYHYFWADHEWVFYIVPHNFSDEELKKAIQTLDLDINKQKRAIARPTPLLSLYYVTSRPLMW
ncbi:MAG: hypothetical protein J7I99_03750 [Methanophagales archaeon]|nr:hypothetical protein [Methanophagales archaeon]